MLSNELVKSNVSDLSDEQVSQVVELANNTFKKELDSKIDEVRGSTFGLVDEVVKEFGYPRQSGKTTEHLKNVLTILNEAKMTDDIKTKLSSLEQKNKDLETQLKSSNPDFSKKEKDYLDKITLLEGALSEQKDSLSKEQQKYKKDILKLQIVNKMPKVREDIGEKTKELHVNTAVNQILESADFDDNDNIIFRDSEGKIMYNPDNKNKPYSIQDMFAKNDYFKEIMHTDSGKKGLGLDNLDNKNKYIPSISGAKTQLEADSIIEKTLLAKGISKTDSNYQIEFDKIRNENQVNKLPMR